MHLINFGGVSAIDELLNLIGVTEELGDFLGKHLTEVLRKQHPDVVIESIEFIKAGDCSAGGTESSDREIVKMTSLCIPIDTHVVLISNGGTHRLDVHVRIIAETSDGKVDVKTDVLIKNQSFN